MPGLATFKAVHTGVAIKLESNHRGRDRPNRNSRDAWNGFSGAGLRHGQTKSGGVSARLPERDGVTLSRPLAVR